MKSNTYTYYRWDPETKREIKEVITAGENGVTQEIIDILHEQDRQERRAQEKFERNEWNFTEEMQNFKSYREKRQELPRTLTGEEIYPIFNIEVMKLDDIKERLVHEFVEAQSPDRQREFYAYYGQMQSYEEIGQAMGKRKQSVYEQLSRMTKNLTKYIDEHTEK